MYAVVDIETTGGNPERDKITEVAIFVHDGTRVVDEFSTLINPERSIPYYITQMTGISDEMVADAPKFYEVARRIVEITEGKVFVAHNAPFDYRFIQAEFKRLGYSYTRETLCTVRLSRKLMPGKPSYSLGNLCGSLGIDIAGRHRAPGDALATVKLLELLLSIKSETTPSPFDPLPDRKGLHPDLDLKQLKDLPASTGVYYFYDDRGVLIYVGKSLNIQSRVMQHLGTPKTNRSAQMRSRIASISYEVTGSELIALLLETSEIKQSKPVFNRMGRRSGNRLGLFQWENENGYLCLELRRLSGVDAVAPLTTFANKDEAMQFMEHLLEHYHLCQRLCGMYTSAGACFHYEMKKCSGACIGEEPCETYNRRVEEAIGSVGLHARSFYLFDRGRRPDEKSVVKVERGKLIGYGFFDPSSLDGNIGLIDDLLVPCPDNRDAHQIIRSFLAKAKPGNVLYFSPESGEGFQ
jgi:DNA polymerase-3 subunit epsilon